jgi:hypothetical protein
MEKYFKLSNYAITYSTRIKGDEIAHALQQFADKLSKNDSLVIDFNGVKAVSYSFLDEFLSGLNKFDLLKEKEISIVGWSNSLLPAIEKSLQQRNCDYLPSKKERKLVCQSN